MIFICVCATLFRRHLVVSLWLSDYLISNIDGFIMLNSFIVHKFSPLLSDVHCALSFTCKLLLNRQRAFEVQDKHKNGNNQKKQNL